MVDSGGVLDGLFLSFSWVFLFFLFPIPRRRRRREDGWFVSESLNSYRGWHIFGWCCFCQKIGFRWAFVSCLISAVKMLLVGWFID